MASDKPLTRTFTHDMRLPMVSYHEKGNKYAWQDTPLQQQAGALKMLFPWINTERWPKYSSLDVMTDGLFLLPTRCAVLRERDYPDPLSTYNAFLDTTLERMQDVLLRVDVHLTSCDPDHITGNSRALAGIAHHENRFLGHDIFPIDAQLGRRFAGVAPADVLSRLDTTPAFEFAADPARVGIILAVHLLAHDYLPDMEVECPGAEVDFLSRGTTYADCPRWHAKGKYLALDWDFFQWARPEHGTATMFTAYPEPGSAR